MRIRLLTDNIFINAVCFTPRLFLTVSSYKLFCQEIFCEIFCEIWITFKRVGDPMRIRGFEGYQL